MNTIQSLITKYNSQSNAALAKEREKSSTTPTGKKELVVGDRVSFYFGTCRYVGKVSRTSWDGGNIHGEGVIEVITDNSPGRNSWLLHRQGVRRLVKKPAKVLLMPKDWMELLEKNQNLKPEVCFRVKVLG